MERGYVLPYLPQEGDKFESRPDWDGSFFVLEVVKIRQGTNGHVTLRLVPWTGNLGDLEEANATIRRVK